MQSRNWRIASLVYHTGSEIKRNNDKKMKQTDEHSKAKSGLSPRRQSRCKVPAVFGGKDLWKRLVLCWEWKKKDLWTEEVMVTRWSGMSKMKVNVKDL